jgi:hypothetical protein
MASSSLAKPTGPKRKAPQHVSSTIKASDNSLTNRNTLQNGAPAASPDDQSPQKRQATVPQSAAAVPQPAAAVPQSAAAIPQSAVVVCSHDAATKYKGTAAEIMQHNLQTAIDAAVKATVAATVSEGGVRKANGLTGNDLGKLSISPMLMNQLANTAKIAAARASTHSTRIVELIANAGNSTSSQMTLNYVATATIHAQKAVNQSEFATMVSELINMAMYM